MKNSSLIIIGAILLMALGAAAALLFKKNPETVVKTISLTDFQAKQITQAARMNYISIDSVKKLLAITSQNLQAAKKINWIDSVKWNVKDSTVIDSSMMIPIYEADSNLVFTKSDSLKKISVIIYENLKQRFLPLQEMFASKVSIDSVQFNYEPQFVEMPEAFYKDKWFWTSLVAVLIIVVKLL